jgi:hypothetical protein
VAWQTATSTGALRLLPYDQTAVVAHTYLAQRSVDGTTHVLADRFATPQNFDPAATAPVLRMYAQLIADMSGQEAYIIEVYREALAKLPSAPE